ncbi:MAG: arginine--tRNA ligase [Clostridia bacterium]
MVEYKKRIAIHIACGLKLEVSLIEGLLEMPPTMDKGDFSLPCFKLAKNMGMSPIEVASTIAGNFLYPDDEVKAVALNAYVNFFIDRTVLTASIVSSTIENGDAFGSSNIHLGDCMCIDFSSVNIAKPFHIGHLSTTVIGNALSRIYAFLGYKVVKINHLGDYGTQFGKLIVAYKKWGDEESVKSAGIRELTRLYVRYHDEAENDTSLDDEARTWFKRIEDGDDEAVSLFDWFKELTLIEVGKVYELLGITFDSYAGESFYSDMMPGIVDELREKGLLKLDQGASIVDLSEYNMPPCLILKSDGASLYATRDLAAAVYRKRTYDFNKLLYVVAYQQELHFKQCFKVLELMGYDWAKDCCHVSYGMVSLTEGTLSTRKGNVAYLMDVLNASINKARDIIEEKSPGLENKEDVAKQIGVGAVVWGPLYNNRIKDIVFSLDKALNFEGETAPYVQYTHARCCSVLRKTGVSKEYFKDIDFSVCEDDCSYGLVHAISAFKGEIFEAMKRNEPYLVARALIGICQSFNRFYTEHKIVDDSRPIEQKARLALVLATKTAIKNGLYLLGISAPEKM